MRVRGERAWNMSRGYYLAVRRARAHVVLRVDCDYEVHYAAVRAALHPLVVAETAFRAGDWRMAGTNDEVHLNRALVIERHSFWCVGSHDQRIVTCAWEPEDLYARLVQRGLCHINVSYDEWVHDSHAESRRTANAALGGGGGGGVEDGNVAQVMIDVNRLLNERVGKWNVRGRSAQYTQMEDGVDVFGGRYSVVCARHIAALLRHLVQPDECTDMWKLSVGRRLADDFDIALDLMATMDVYMKLR